MSCTPLYPMVLLIIIPFLNGYFIGNINPTFSGPNPQYHDMFAVLTHGMFAVLDTDTDTLLGWHEKGISGEPMLTIYPYFPYSISMFNGLV